MKHPSLFGRLLLLLLVAESHQPPLQRANLQLEGLNSNSGYGIIIVVIHSLASATA